MLELTFIIFTCLLIMGLNIIATRTILGTHLITIKRKRNLLILIWLVPVFGFILSIIIFNGDMKKKKENSDKELITALNSFTEKMNTANKEIKQKRKNEGN